MGITLEGSLAAKGLRFAIVVSKFNSFITESLLSAATNTILKNGGLASDITVAHVPGAFEIPLACKKLAETKKYDAIVALGAVIRGQTYHFEMICNEAARGVMQVSLQTEVPISLGIISANTLEQAVERASDNADNKGIEAAQSVIEMANLFKQTGGLND